MQKLWGQGLVELRADGLRGIGFEMRLERTSNNCVSLGSCGLLQRALGIALEAGFSPRKFVPM